MCRLLPRASALAFAACVLGATPAWAAGEEPRFESLLERFRTPALRVTALFQVVADFQPERSFAGQNGFSLANTRLGIAGQLDRDFSYLLRANFTASGGPSILDARLSYAPRADVAVDFGQFKVPFSKEFLTGAGTIDFVNRAQVVSALVPGRQIGAQVRGTTAGERLALAAGLWNGNAAASNGNDDDRFLYAARATLRPLASPGAPGPLELGANVAVSRDRSSSLLAWALPGFAGRRRLAGADVRWTRGNWLASGEVIGARLEPDAGGRVEPWGFQVTWGYRWTPWLQGLARFERFRADGAATDLDLFIAGLNVTDSRPIGIQVNLVRPTNADRRHRQLLLNAQLDF